ncbi:hypothetical protein GCM10010282_53870 [Streptomyces roseolus]|nr:hypothetical protein GCM10010282_53870 [Streptomyces roseolus]
MPDRSGLPAGMPAGGRRGRPVERRHRLAEALTRIHPAYRPRNTDRSPLPLEDPKRRQAAGPAP